MSNPRRGFLAGLAAIVGAVVALLTPIGAAIASLLHPMREKSAGGMEYRVATLDSLPDNGEPRKFPIIADRGDAWNRFPQEPIGAIFLRKLGPKQVVAINVVCPHAGCFITFDAGKKGFYCPCHQGNFDLEGKRTDAKSPSPRDLDTLVCEIRDNAVWVKFENYRTGTTEKIVQV